MNDFLEDYRGLIVFLTSYAVLWGLGWWLDVSVSAVIFIAIFVALFFFVLMYILGDGDNDEKLLTMILGVAVLSILLGTIGIEHWLGWTKGIIVHVVAIGFALTTIINHLEINKREKRQMKMG